MSNLYENSWKLYKAQSEIFTDDYEYYFNFCKNHKTLELFAGYGRLTNYLCNRGVDIEAIEFEPKFGEFITIDKSKIHIMDVLEFNSHTQYERIIAGYNSFCLFTSEIDIKRFFSLVDSLLMPGGYASLNYYDISNWKNALLTKIYNERNEINYLTNFKSTSNNKEIGTWTDEYESAIANEFKKFKFEYPVRVYQNVDALYPFFKHTSLKLVDVIKDFGLESEKISESGWIDYVFQK